MIWFTSLKQWNETSHIRTRNDVERFKHEWLPVIERILLEINEYLVTGQIRVSEIGEIVSDTIVATIIERNKFLVSEEIKRASRVNTVINAYISVWWNNVQAEFVSDELDMFNAYSKVVLLNWSNRIIFAHLIKYNHNAAIEVNSLSFDSTIGEANQTFQRITESCDFYNIFNGLDFNELLPEETGMI